MKKLILMAVALVVASAFFTSCKDEEDPIPAPVVTDSLDNKLIVVVQGHAVKLAPTYTNVDEFTTYTWTDQDGNVLATTPTYTAENKERGSYVYTVTVKNAGGVATYKYAIEVDRYWVNVDFEGDYWNGLIDTPQYYGPMLYGDGSYSWTDETTSLSSKLTNAWGDGKFWGGGIAISDYIDDDLENHKTWDYQLAVPISNGSKNFAVAYCEASISFADGKAHLINTIDVCPTTYCLGVCKYGNTSAASLAKDGSLRLEITGVFADGSEELVNTVDFARNGTLLEKWIPVQLSHLGAVKALKFTMTGSDVSDYGGINTPTYFAFDNVVVDANGE